MIERAKSQSKKTKLAMYIGLPSLWIALGIVLIVTAYPSGGAFFIGGAVALAIVITKAYHANRETFWKPPQRGDKTLWLSIAISSIAFALLMPYLDILSNKVARLLLGA